MGTARSIISQSGIVDKCKAVCWKLTVLLGSILSVYKSTSPQIWECMVSAPLRWSKFFMFWKLLVFLFLQSAFRHFANDAAGCTIGLVDLLGHWYAPVFLSIYFLCHHIFLTDFLNFFAKKIQKGVSLFR